ncbi:hypothetical protein [Symbiopectobacterium sp. RP]|uniref:hypothetical protein n=1 Tax=Symbiopectobacterium sp. RP TaxID=3248553 RepID=UPI003D278653
MKVLQLSYHYTKSHVFNSGSSAVKLASLTKKDKDIQFARNILNAKNESIKKLKNVDFKLYDSKLKKNHKLFSRLVSLSVKDSPFFEGKNFDFANSLKKAISDFEKNPNKAIKKHLNGHINNINPHSKIGRGYISYLENRK